MNTVENRINLFLLLTLLFSSPAFSQVPVSKEPSHHQVFQNEYIRILDVSLKPTDTTQFHIHSTPSLFLHLSKTMVCSQIKGKEWIKEQCVPGNAWYRSFRPDILVHRVSNCDTVSFHVTDIEILSSYDTANTSQIKHLPFELIFENEKALAYRITTENIKQKIVKNRGPLIAELASGTTLFFHNAETKQSKEIKTGQYLYIHPGTSFYFTANNVKELNAVLFEIK